jgi:hypothetical protein
MSKTNLIALYVLANVRFIVGLPAAAGCAPTGFGLRKIRNINGYNHMN